MDSVPIYCRIWNIFEYIKEVLKQVRVTLCRTDVLHYRNGLLICSRSKFDELKEFHLVLFEKKRTNFATFGTFFSNVK